MMTAFFMVLFSIIGGLIKGFIKIIPHGVKYGWIFVFVASLISIYLLSIWQEEALFMVFVIMGLGILGTVLKIRSNDKIAIAAGKITDPDPPSQLCTENTLKGLVFGTKNNRYIARPENLEGHLMVVGGVGSGKSTCIAIPTLRVWNSRVFAIDIKDGELYKTTSNYRSDIKVFNPQIKDTYGYDPYVFLRNSRNPSQEARLISESIIPLPPDIKDPFWIESAQAILTGAILHFYIECSFIETLYNILDHNPPELINIISNSGNRNARTYVNSFVGMDSRTLSSVFSQLARAIEVFVTDEDIIYALSKTDSISPEDLEYGYDIYIQIPEHLLHQWKNLLTLIVNQFLTFFERRDVSSKIPILFLLDEFPRLGKIPAILNGLATLRSKNITVCLFLQSLSQLDVIYGVEKRKVIVDTCSYKAILSASDADTQEYFSKLVGTYDKWEDTITDKSPVMGVETGRHETLREKRVIKPEQFSTLASSGDIMILHQLEEPGFLKVKKMPYYEVWKTEVNNYSRGV